VSKFIESLQTKTTSLNVETIRLQTGPFTEPNPHPNLKTLPNPNSLPKSIDGLLFAKFGSDSINLLIVLANAVSYFGECIVRILPGSSPSSRFLNVTGDI
jgi:hypothetical protein